LGEAEAEEVIGRVGRVAIGAGPTLAKTTLGLGAVKIDPQRQIRVKQNKSLVADAI